tara:strand:- start:57 stop:335 length:279 start_codon:yes stop_codon:yes gene_type:complete
MNLNIEHELEQLVLNHWKSYKSAPKKAQYVFGVRGDSKYDLQSAFKENLRELRNLAELVKPEMVEKITGMVVAAEKKMQELSIEDNPYLEND